MNFHSSTTTTTSYTTPTNIKTFSVTRVSTQLSTKMLPEPPEFDMGEKVSFKYMKREKERTIFSREVGEVAAIRWDAPFYEFVLEGDCVDKGRWYRQTELESIKAVKDLVKVGEREATENSQAIAIATSKLHEELEATKIELSASCNQIATLSLIAEKLAAARNRITDLEISAPKSISEKENQEAKLYQAFQELKSARLENESNRKQVATLSKFIKPLKAELATANTRIAEFNKDAVNLGALEKQYDDLIGRHEATAPASTTKAGEETQNKEKHGGCERV